MSVFTRVVAAALFAAVPLSPVAAQEGVLSISTTFGTTADIPDPRAGYNG